MPADARYGAPERATARERDLVAAITDDWRREMPELDRPQYELTKRASRLEQLQEQALSDCLAPWNLTRAEFNVLGTLRIAGAPYELRPTDIRKRLLVPLTSGGMTNVLNRLVQMKLAERIPDQNDGRSSWVRLTATGVKVAEQTAHAWAATQDRFFSGLSPKLARQAADILHVVLLAVGDREPTPIAIREAISGIASAQSDSG
jgi:DNA-binding MarR family transcriptional regulator